MKNARSMSLVPFLLALGLPACGSSDNGEESAAAAASGPLVVCAVNHPLACMAARIGGEAVQVEFPAPADEDPAYWSPDPEVVLRYQEADLILCNGAGYAGWIERASLPASRTVDTSAAVADRFIALDETVTHAHGPEGDHSHTGTAFTTWLDLTLALEQARAILAALERARPDEAEGFRTRFAALDGELGTLDARLAAAAGRDPGRPLLGSHPVYQYLAQRYELNLVSVHFEPDEVPADEAWQELQGILADHPATWMLWEGEPLEEIARRLEELGVNSVVFAPCGSTPEQGDFLSVMQDNAAALEQVFAAGS